MDTIRKYWQALALLAGGFVGAWLLLSFNPGLSGIALGLGVSLAVFRWLREKLENASFDATFLSPDAWTYVPIVFLVMIAPAWIGCSVAVDQKSFWLGLLSGGVLGAAPCLFAWSVPIAIVMQRFRKQ